MNMKNDSKHTKEISGFKILSLLTLITAIIGLWPFISYNREYRRCVQLKNGLNLGYNAVFDMSDPYLQPHGVPKYPDGTPLFDQPSWSVFITHTTVYGRTFGKPGEKAFDYVWRADKGLVRKKKDRETYQKLMTEAGPANAGLGTGDKRRPKNRLTQAIIVRRV